MTNVKKEEEVIEISRTNTQEYWVSHRNGDYCRVQKEQKESGQKLYSLGTISDDELWIVDEDL